MENLVGIEDLNLTGFMSHCPLGIFLCKGEFKRVPSFHCSDQYVVWEGMYWGCHDVSGQRQ